VRAVSGTKRRRTVLDESARELEPIAAPSINGTVPEIKRNQFSATSAPQVEMFRPAGDWKPIPIALIHPAFARFETELESVDVSNEGLYQDIEPGDQNEWCFRQRSALTGQIALVVERLFG
jgi:hypothetical protein